MTLDMTPDRPIIALEELNKFREKFHGKADAEWIAHKIYRDPDEQTHQMIEAMLTGLRYSSPYYWSSQLLPLLIAGSQQLSDSATIVQQDLLAPCGWLWFANPIIHESHDYDLRALSWVATVLPGTRDKDFLPTTFNGVDYDGIVVSSFGRKLGSGDSGVLTPICHVNFAFGSTLKELKGSVTDYFDKEEYSVPEEAELYRMRLMIGALLFMQQRILSRSPYLPTRAERRRAQREDHNIGDLQVVKLRVQDYRQSGAESNGPVSWNYQWAVRGHWRDQPYPSEGRSRIIWIDQYIKGPEDKPLKNPEKLFAVVR